MGMNRCVILVLTLAAAACVPPAGGPPQTGTATAVGSDANLPKGPPASLEVVKTAIRKQVENPGISDYFIRVTSLDVAATPLPDLYAWHAVREGSHGLVPPGQAPFLDRSVVSGTFSWAKQTLTYTGETPVGLSSDQQATAARATAQP